MAARFSFVKYDFIYPDVSPGYIIIPMYAIYHWLNWANSDEDIGTWHGSFDAQNDRHDAAVWALLGAFQKYTQFLVGISGSSFGGDREKPAFTKAICTGRKMIEVSKLEIVRSMSSSHGKFYP